MPPALSKTIAPPLTISLFGPLSVLVEGQSLPHLRSRKAQWLLALLTLRNGRSVEREWLAGTLWPEVESSLAFANLRPILSELRKALGSQSERLQSPNRHTLRLDLTEAEVDVRDFDAAMISKGIPALERAVLLYRGPLLEGCSEDWVSQERSQREQACLQALNTLGTAAVEGGENEAALNYYRRAVTLDPLWDVAQRGLMVALDKGGDRNAALQVYREFAATLRSNDLRAVPGEETTALYQRLRTEARQQAGVSSTDNEKQRNPEVVGYLPHPLTELVGREDERLDVADRLRRSRLVTLTGPGGIGKTRLALAVAHEVVREYPDGVWLVALESLPPGSGSNAEERRPILQQIASVLGVKEGGGRSLLTVMMEHLRQKRVLLVLDNCEHLLEPCAGVVSHLLQVCPKVRILATSREALRVSGEAVWPVPAFAVPDIEHLPTGRTTLVRALVAYDAVQLFLQRAEAVRKTFALTGDNARDIALLCSRLSGIPLALELAAARTAVLTPGQILSQFDAQPLDALSSRQRDTVPRHQTLRATLEWSYKLLSVDAQMFLTCMGIFRGGWKLEAAQAVCPDAPALEMLSVLQEASLVNVNEEAGVTRFSLLETVRRFAMEELERSGRIGEVQRCHAKYYNLWLVRNHQGWVGLRGPEFLHFLVLTESEYANVSAALIWAREANEVEMLVEFSFCLKEFWNGAGRMGETRYWSETTAYQIAEMIKDYSATEDSSRVASLSTLRDNHRTVQVNFFAAIGDFDAASELCFQAFEDIRRTGNPIDGRTLLFNAAVSRMPSNLKWSLATLQQCLPLEQAASTDGRANPVILSQLAFVARLVGQRENAAFFLSETLGLCRGREEQDPHGYMRTLWYAGCDAISSGDLMLAQEYFETGISISRNLGDVYATANMLCGLSALAHEKGDKEQVQIYLSEANAVVGAEPAINMLVVLHRRQAEFLLIRGDRTDATGLVITTLALLRGKALSFRLYIYPLLLLLAEMKLSVSAERHHTEQAARLLGTAMGLAERLGLVTPDRAERERVLRLRTILFERLGPERFAIEEATGAALDDEAALEFALAVER